MYFSRPHISPAEHSTAKSPRTFSPVSGTNGRWPRWPRATIARRVERGECSHEPADSARAPAGGNRLRLHWGEPGQRAADPRLLAAPRTPCARDPAGTGTPLGRAHPGVELGAAGERDSRELFEG